MSWATYLDKLHRILRPPLLVLDQIHHFFQVCVVLGFGPQFLKLVHIVFCVLRCIIKVFEGRGKRSWNWFILGLSLQLRTDFHIWSNCFGQKMTIFCVCKNISTHCQQIAPYARLFSWYRPGEGCRFQGILLGSGHPGGTCFLSNVWCNPVDTPEEVSQPRQGFPPMAVADGPPRLVLGAVLPFLQKGRNLSES